MFIASAHSPGRRGSATATGSSVARIANGFDLMGFDPFYQQITLGVILLLAVGLDAWSRKTD